MQEKELYCIVLYCLHEILRTATNFIVKDYVDNNNRENSSPPVSASATVALSYLKQPMVVREAAVAAARVGTKLQQCKATEFLYWT